MVLAYHVILTTYGFWLPNDPRGSWSDFVRRWELFLHGRATKTSERRSVAHKTHDQHRRRAAKTALKYPPVYLTGLQAQHVVKGFELAAQESAYVIHACSILPQHVHMVIARHERIVERIIGHLKARSTQQLVEKNLHPFVQYQAADGRFPSVWAHRAWKVYLNSVEDIHRAISYVEQNPIKDGRKPQRWRIVTATD